MNCSCITVWDGEEEPEFYSAKTKIANKQYKCCECGAIINPKEKYEQTSGKWGGKISRYKTCATCCEIRSAFFCSWMYTAVWEDLGEVTLEGLSQTKIAELSKSARDKLLDFFEERDNA